MVSWQASFVYDGEVKSKIRMPRAHYIACLLLGVVPDTSPSCVVFALLVMFVCASLALSLNSYIDMKIYRRPGIPWPVLHSASSGCSTGSD